MKQLFILCFTLLLAATGKAAEWLTDYRTALNQAQAEGKVILVNFTGSDWCSWCIRLQNEVFSKPEFQAFADQNLVLLEVDFPRRKQLPAAVKQANENMAHRFSVTGFPTLVVLNQFGIKMGQHGYVRGGPRSYIAELKKTPGFVAKDVPESGTAAATTAKPGQTKKVETPAYAIAPPVIHYNELALKGISGGRVPMALINNKSFAAGETAKVKVGDKTVEVQVKEIRADSVLAQIEGEPEPRELKLKKPDLTKE